MNFRTKPFSLFAGTLVVVLSLAAAFPAFSQSTPQPTPNQRREKMGRPNFLNLTPEQQAQMQQIREAERTAIENILTAEQKAQLQSDRQNRRPPQRDAQRGTPRNGENRGPRPLAGNPGLPPGPFAALNLTAEQKSQIAAVMQSSRQQMDALLTAEQRQQMQQHLQQHQQRRQAPPASN